jgi:hypothetical protein
MNPILTAYQMGPDTAKVEPLLVTRDWMDATPEKHAYHCFPVTVANTVGWTISMPVDIKFIWDGLNDTSGDHITILEGESYVYTGRGQSSVSFNTNLLFKSDEKISLLTMTVPNYFNPDYEVISSLISTSFFRNPLPLAIKALTPNKEILIPAGTPIATILPISLSTLKDSVIEVKKFPYEWMEEWNSKNKAYGDAAQVLSMKGQWTDWYRDAVDQDGNKIGEHEVKALKLKTEYTDIES